jgi:hypothetical protein
MRKVLFPTDILTFGKHKGKTFAQVIDEDKQYYQFLLREQAITVTELVENYANGINNLVERLKYNIEGDYIVIYKQQMYVLPVEKFVRKRERHSLVNKTEVERIKIPCEYTIEKQTRTKSYLGNGIQSDDRVVVNEYTVDVKVYKDPECFRNFVESVKSKYNIK